MSRAELLRILADPTITSLDVFIAHEGDKTPRYVAWDFEDGTLLDEVLDTSEVNLHFQLVSMVAARRAHQRAKLSA